jgi:hypothetical protein
MIRVFDYRMLSAYKYRFYSKQEQEMRLRHSLVFLRNLHGKLTKRLSILRCSPPDGRLSPAEQVPLPSLRMMASTSVEARSPSLKTWEDVRLHP